MITRLTLIRHGHTAWNAAGRYQGHAPVPLSERGLAQARCLAVALASGEPVAAIYSSDLPRCRQTAVPIAAALGLDVTYDARFRELDYGHWQGLTREELAALDDERYAAFRADPFEVQIPGGESQRMLAARVINGLMDVLAAHPGQHVLLVTHGGPIREILRHFGLWAGRYPAGNASRTVLEVGDGGTAAAVRLWSDVTFLPPELRPDTAGPQFVVPR